MARLLTFAVLGEQVEQHAAHQETRLVGRHVTLDARMHVERHVEVRALQYLLVLGGDASVEGDDVGRRRLGSASLRKQNCTICEAPSFIGVAAVMMM